MSAKRYPLPNLFKNEKPQVASSLYAVGVPTLLWRGEAEESLRQLRLVRRFARQTKVKPGFTNWTFNFEREALIVLGRYEAAWRLVSAERRRHFPRWASAPLEKRIKHMEFFVRFSEVPAAYFSGRIKHATRAMEAYLALRMPALPAYEHRYCLYNGDERPNPNCHTRVTLTHLYAESGRTLQDWPLWRTWVERLHPKLLELTKLSREDLANDASLMPTFHERLCVIEKERRPEFLTFGEKDLTEPKKKVLARQKSARKRINKSQRGAVDFYALRNRYFPWLSA